MMKNIVLVPLFVAMLWQPLLQQSSVLAAESTPLVVAIAAKKFAYVPQQVTLKRGVPVVLKLSTEDRSHGFSIPAMDVRADIEPGKITELKITPNKVGDFEFFCDTFCGSGHDGMTGKIKVTE